MIAVIFFADNMASAFTPRAQSYFSARHKPILWIILDQGNDCAVRSADAYPICAIEATDSSVLQSSHDRFRPYFSKISAIFAKSSFASLKIGSMQ